SSSGADSIAAASRRRTGAQTLSVMPSLNDRGGDTSSKEASKRIDSFPLLSTLADKALALGRAEDAERILSALLIEVLKSLEEGLPVNAQTVDHAAQYGVRFAVATGKGSWVDYVIRLYAQLRRPCPAPIVDELHNAVRKINSVDLPALRAYVTMLREQSSIYG